jgi:hypothetical protein
MRKIYATVKVNLIIRADDDMNLNDFVDGLEIKAICHHRKVKHKADIEDVTTENFEVTDSK